ncbi:hypothetical protein MCW_01172 [Cardidatus Bartonella washoeensis 085-0475]|uniref:Uncharacterized protein n=1 Tax=Cardidatus Bartonella washoeensis 085-0475 TaxID=1094564 RepID=J1JIN8_9HYPH|nr:hypothetical protein MCW_01172 [Bartonella washoeensis 085-0475]
MNIRYEIIRMFCMLIVFVPILATTSKLFGGWSWKLSITIALLSGILFFIVDYLCRYFVIN